MTINPDGRWNRQQNEGAFNGRQWAEDQPWEECDCPSPTEPTEYVRADLYYAAIRIEAGTGGTVKHGPTRSARAGAEGIAQPQTPSP